MNFQNVNFDKEYNKNHFWRWQILLKMEAYVTIKQRDTEFILIISQNFLNDIVWSMISKDNFWLEEQIT